MVKESFIVMQCISDPADHGVNGLGNQMYTIANNAVLSQMYRTSFAIGSPVVRAAFQSARAIPNACISASEWPAFRREPPNHNVSTRWWWWQSTKTQPQRPEAMQRLFASRYEPWLWKELRLIQASLPQIYTVVHLRTQAESYCVQKLTIGSCGQCVPMHSLRCAHANVIGTVALLFTDHNGSQMRQLLVKRNTRSSEVTYRTEEELNIKKSFNRVRFSLSTRRNPRTFAAIIWALAYEAPHFIGSASSTLSKSIAMARFGKKSTVLVDMRCKHKRGDGMLFTCRNATLHDLV